MLVCYLDIFSYANTLLNFNLKNLNLYLVYFNYQLDGESKWIFLGKICNQKPSCIFKITSLKHEANFAESMPFSALAKPSHISTAMVGISVEPVAQIDALTPAIEAQPTSNSNSFAEFSQKMLENFYK